MVENRRHKRDIGANRAAAHMHAQVAVDRGPLSRHDQLDDFLLAIALRRIHGRLFS
jgi:hypothetical protein